MTQNPNYFRGAKLAAKMRRINEGIAVDQAVAKHLGKKAITIKYSTLQFTVPVDAKVRIHSNKRVEIF